MAPLLLQQPVLARLVGVPRAEPMSLPGDAVPACSQPPPSKNLRCDKAVDRSLLVHYLGDLRHDINQSSPEGPLPYAGTTAVPCMGPRSRGFKGSSEFCDHALHLPGVVSRK